MALATGELEMADSISAAALKDVAADAYGCYDNGNWPDYDGVAAEHPGSRIVDFTVYRANVGTGGDVEKGDMNPADGAAWIKERQASGVWRPIGYASIGDSVNGMPALVHDAQAAGIQDGSWRKLSAHYGWNGQLPGLKPGQHICGPHTCGSPIQCDGTQWESTPDVDWSLLAADFFGPAPAGGPSPGTNDVVGITLTPEGDGYWLVAADGHVWGFGPSANHFGDLYGKPLNKPLVGIAGDPGQHGYWLAGSDGGVFPFGVSTFDGSEGGKTLNAPIVGITATKTGKGYWLVAADGGVFAFGDAKPYGSMGGQHLNKPVVGITRSEGGAGYLLVAADGGIFAFGDAKPHGSAGNLPLAHPIVGMALNPAGGYWLVGSDGGIFTYGPAGFYGSTGGIHLNKPVVGMAASSTGDGYLLVASDGGVFAFGDAKYAGSAA